MKSNNEAAFKIKSEEKLTKKTEDINGRKNILLLPYMFIFIFLISSVSAIPVMLSDQGTDVKNSGTVLSSGDLTMLIYSASTGETPIFNQTFTGAIINGSWNLMINPDLEFGRSYWKDYAINGVNLNFSGNDRLEFTSPVGYINNASFVNFSLIQSCPSGQAIKQVNSDGSVICEGVSAGLIDTIWNITGSDYLINASGILNVNESKLNSTIDARIPVIGYQSNAAGWINSSIETNTSLNANIGGNLTTKGNGFFGWLGSAASRIATLFVQDIDSSGNIVAGGSVTAIGNVTGSQVCIGTDCRSAWPAGESGTNITGSKYIVNSSGVLDVNETRLNNTIDARASVYNETSLINNVNDTLTLSKLDVTDQRYNETNYVNNNFYIKLLCFIISPTNNIHLYIINKSH